MLFVAGSIEPTGLAGVKYMFWTGMETWGLGGLVGPIAAGHGNVGPWGPVCVLTSVFPLSAGKTSM